MATKRQIWVNELRLEGDDFLKILNKQGFTKTNYYPLSFGIVSMYVAIK